MQWPEALPRGAPKADFSTKNCWVVLFLILFYSLQRLVAWRAVLRFIFYFLLVCS